MGEGTDIQMECHPKCRAVTGLSLHLAPGSHLGREGNSQTTKRTQLRGTSASGQRGAAGGWRPWPRAEVTVGTHSRPQDEGREGGVK